jgi:hypothetical protein
MKVWIYLCNIIYVYVVTLTIIIIFYEGVFTMLAFTPFNPLPLLVAHFSQ